MVQRPGPVQKTCPEPNSTANLVMWARTPGHAFQYCNVFLPLAQYPAELFMTVNSSYIKSDFHA